MSPVSPRSGDANEIQELVDPKMEHASVQRSSSSRSDADDPTGGSIFVDEPKLSPGVQIPSASKKACLSLSNEPPYAPRHFYGYSTDHSTASLQSP